MRSAVGIRTHSRKRGEQEPGSREPPAAACRSPQPSSSFGEDSVLAPSVSRKMKLSRQFTVFGSAIFCVVIFSLYLMLDRGHLDYPKSPRREGSFPQVSTGVGLHERRRGGPCSPLLRDLFLPPRFRAGAGRGRTGGGSEPPTASALQRSDDGAGDP